MAVVGVALFLSISASSSSSSSSSGEQALEEAGVEAISALGEAGEEGAKAAAKPDVAGDAVPENSDSVDGRLSCIGVEDNCGRSNWFGRTPFCCAEDLKPSMTL